MVIIAGSVDVDPAQREAALEAARPHMQATRAQKGCLHYTWVADERVAGRIYVYELWDGAANLELHFAGPHHLNMRNTIGAHGLRGADVLKYEVARSRPVYDAQMKPRADFFQPEGFSRRSRLPGCHRARAPRRASRARPASRDG